MGFLVASSSSSSSTTLGLRVILIFLLLAALASSVVAAAGTTYKVGDDAGWIERSNVYYNVWSSTKKFYVGDILHFVYDPSDWNGLNIALQVTPTAFDTCDDSSPIAVYTTGNDYVTLNHTGQYYFISHYECLTGYNMLDIYVQPRPHDDADNSNDFIPSSAPEPTTASPSSSSASSASSPTPSPAHYDNIGGTTTITTTTTTTTSTISASSPTSSSTGASASSSSSTSLLLGMLAAAAVLIIY